MTRTNNIHDIFLIEICRPFIIEDDRGICTLFQPLRIGWVIIRQCMYLMLGDKLHLNSCPFERVVPVT